MKKSHKDYLAKAIDFYEAQGHEYPVAKALYSLNEQHSYPMIKDEDEEVAKIATAKGYTKQQRYNSLGHAIPTVIDWVKEA